METVPMIMILTFKQPNRCYMVSNSRWWLTYDPVQSKMLIALAPFFNSKRSVSL